MIQQGWEPGQNTKSNLKIKDGVAALIITSINQTIEGGKILGIKREKCDHKSRDQTVEEAADMEYEGDCGVPVEVAPRRQGCPA